MIPMLTKRLAQMMLKVAEKPTGVRIFERLNELKANERLSLAQIERIREKKIQRLLKYAAQSSPFYRNRFEKLGKKPWSFDELGEVDPVSKEELKSNLSQIRCEQYPGKFRIAKTSGSTGIPLAFPKHCTTEAYHYAIMYRGHSWYGLEPGDREARLWGVPVQPLDRITMRVKDYFLNRLRESKYNLTEETLERFYESILKYKPKYLMGYGGMLREFADYLLSTDRDLGVLHLRMVKYTSEGIRDDEISRMEEVFCCPIVCEYGASETGIISFQCHRGGHHLMHDCLHVELIDGDAPYPFKEILVTDLNNLLFPVIRYKLGDIVMPSKQECGCGLPFPVLGKIQGRNSEVFEVIIGGQRKKFHSIVFYYIMKECATSEKHLVQFCVVQKEPNLFNYQLVIATRSPILEECISLMTKQELGGNVNVEFEYVSEISREISGKLKDFVSIVKGSSW